MLGGGGYNPWTTARLWAGFWGLIAGFALPDTLPERAQQILSALSCDLVDDEDHDPAWLTRLADPPLGTEIRSEVERLIAQALPRVRVR